MVAVRARREARRATGSPRIGLFGLLGAGNTGNDGSLRAVLTHLRERHPGAHLELMAGGLDRGARRFGVPVTRMHRSPWEYRTASSLVTAVRKVAGKAVDTVRLVRWVRRLDFVIVPGMGVLEATAPMRPWGFPYSLFVLSVAARLCGTPLALVCVGADPIEEAAIRWLVVGAARLATYRSYRDGYSRDAMRAMGVDTSRDQCSPDLAFALPTPSVPSPGRVRTGVIGLGVMAFRGRNTDRGHSEEVAEAYVGALEALVRRLLDSGREVRIFTGDHEDESVATRILADLRADPPAPGASRSLTVLSVPDLDGLMREMASMDVVIATRFHGVLCALKSCRPTIAIGYAAKHRQLMESMGLGEFSHSARQIDPDLMLEQVVRLEGRAEELTVTLAERNRANRELLERQFAALSAVILGAHETPSETCCGRTP